MTGLELKLMRVAADVKAIDLADVMGVSKSRISYIEGRRVVSADAEARYRTALSTCATNSKNGPQREEVA